MFQDLLDAISSSQAEMAYCNFCYEYEDGKIETVYTALGIHAYDSLKRLLRISYVKK